jgi:enoyl-CoA hydratase/carnithine racemase
MDYSEIIYEVEDKIATITLNRPDKLNAWTGTMEGEYRHAMADAEQRDDVRVIIVTGAGKGFCAGADMSLLSSVAGGGDASNAFGNGVDANPGSGPGVPEDFRKQYSFPLGVGKPILAAINGAAAGLGLIHSLYCDIRFASETAKFTTAFAQRGLIAEHGISWLLPRIVGIQNALDLMYSARVFKADEALRLGLVSRVYPPDELMPAVREYAKQLATFSSPRSLREMKRELYGALFTSLGPAIDTAVGDMLESLKCDDFKEGVASFVEKREPQFTGN